MIKPIVEEAFRRENYDKKMNWRDVVVDVQQALQSRKPAIFRYDHFESAGRIADEMIQEGYRLHHWQAVNGAHVMMLFFPDPHPEGTVDVLWLQSHIREWRDAQPSGEARAAFDKVLDFLP